MLVEVIGIILMVTVKDEEIPEGMESEPAVGF
jgi:hypothetical protein